MNQKTILIFGESKGGDFQKPLLFRTLPELSQSLGEPAKNSSGIHLAVQALLCNQNVLYYKISEEGSNPDQYLLGFKHLEKYPPEIPISATLLPGVSSPEILTLANHFISHTNSLLLFTEKDLYDLLTQ
jgi:hypothetical protein